MNKTDVKYLFLITIIFIAACIETDIYLPAFPDMMAYFRVSEETIQSILTWNFLGICVACPLYGPVSDSFGRKKPLMAALGLFLVGSLMTLWAESFELMLWGRVLQGIGSGGTMTIGTAVIFDVFQGEKVVRALAQLNTIVPFIMAAAPLAGGALNCAFGFRSNFLAIVICVLVSLVLSLFFFDETLEKEKRTPFRAKKIMSDFKRALTCIPLWQTIIIVSLYFAGYIVFLSGTALLFMVEFGVSKAIFPLFQGTILLAWLAASLTCGRAISKWGIPKLKIIGTVFVLAGGVGLGLAAWLSPLNPYLLTAPILLYAFGANWTQGIYFPEGMELLPDIKGVTASILTTARLLLSAVIVGLASRLYDGTIYPLAAVIGGVLAVILPTIVFYERSQRNRKRVETIDNGVVL